MAELTRRRIAIVQRLVERLAPIPPAEVERFLRAEARAVEYPRGACFTTVGDASGRVGFVLHGAFRVCYRGAKGAKHVRNFCVEGTPIGPYATLLEGQPSNVDIEALEPSEVIELPYAAMVKKFAASHAWERLGRRIAEQHYVSRARREHALLALDAGERLERFFEELPTLEARLKNHDIAAYIGVRPETLSRLLKARAARASASGPRASSPRA